MDSLIDEPSAPPPMASSETIRARWAQFAEAIERLAERIGDSTDFQVRPDSSLAGDDRAFHPFEVSQTLRHLINATVDQLHGVKTAVHDGEQMHIAVSADDYRDPANTDPALACAVDDV